MSLAQTLYDAHLTISGHPITWREIVGNGFAELGRYVRRVSDRWPLERALLGGARVADAHGAGAQRERGPEYVVVLVSDFFDGVPWLERVYVCGSLWDAYEMGAPADVHCYTPGEFERKLDQLAVVREAAERGLELLPEPA